MHVPRSRQAAIALLLVVGAAACQKADDAAALSTDSSLQRDLTIAGTSTPPSQIDLKDVPESPPPVQEPARAPVTPTRRPPPVQRAPTPPASTPPTVVPTQTTTLPTPTVPATPPAPRVGTVAAGTNMTLAVESRVCTTATPGDRLTATLAEGVVGTDGAMIPSGAKVIVEVASVTQGEGGTDPTMTFRVISLALEDSTYVLAGNASPADTLEKAARGGTVQCEEGRGGRDRRCDPWPGHRAQREGHGDRCGDGCGRGRGGGEGNREIRGVSGRRLAATPRAVPTARDTGPVVDLGPGP